VGRGRSEVVPDKDVAEDRCSVEDKDTVDCRQTQGGRLAALDASRDKES